MSGQLENAAGYMRAYPMEIAGESLILKCPDSRAADPRFAERTGVWRCKPRASGQDKSRQFANRPVNNRPVLGRADRKKPITGDLRPRAPICATSGVASPAENLQFFSSYVVTLVLIETLIAMIVATSEADATAAIYKIEAENQKLG